MKFIDVVKLKVSAGKGGDGIIAFRRELYVPKGGPSGGDGGHGGNIIFVGDEGMSTLLDLRATKLVRASDGENGANKDMHGKKGEHTYVKVPLGTIIKNVANNEIMGDIIAHNQELIVAKGGVGGKGNARFATSTNRVPRICEKGAPGESSEILCELKLLANVGLVGLPNAGKSTFLGAVSSSKPQVADYPFTTLKPHLGVVRVYDQTFVMADLPGLIAGASLGKGLGLQFLRHIERCEILVHLIDISQDSDDHAMVYELINHELENYSPEILKKPQIVVANKIDILENDEIVKQLAQKIGKKVWTISALAKIGLQPLLEEIAAQVKAKKSEVKTEVEFVAYKLYEYKESQDEQLNVSKTTPTSWEVKGDLVHKAFLRNPLNTYQNILLFKVLLQDLGVYDELRKQGAKPEDTIKVYDWEFVWE